jgi:hypothetical protein
MLDGGLAIGGFAVAMLGLGAVNWYLIKRRTEGFMAFAEEARLTFSATSSTVEEQLSRFKVYGAGRSRAARNVLEGVRDDRRVTLFDFAYTEGSGKNSTRRVHTLCLVDGGGGEAPPFFVRRQSAISDRLGKLFGGQDLDFEDDPTFSKGWVLQSTDEPGARAFFTPRVRSFFAERSGSLVAEHHDGVLLVDFTRQVKVDELEELLSTAVNLRRHWS